MNSDTPRTDAGCAPVYFNNGTSTIAADPEISRQLERELTIANERIAQLKEAGGAMCRQLRDDRATENDWQERAIQAIENWKQALT